MNPKQFIPSPDEIRKACQSIRSNWSSEERQSRQNQATIFKAVLEDFVDRRQATAVA